MSLLAWLIDVYELKRTFDEQQASGTIPPDEPFDPFFFMGADPKGERFPYWFSAKPRIRLQQFFKRGLLKEPFSSGFIGYDAKDVMRGIEYIRLTDAAGVYVTTAMRPQQFPVYLADLLDEILFVQLADRVQRWLQGEVGATPLTKIHATVDEMKRSLTFGRAHGYGSIVGVTP